jgi:hypothetical protein
VNSSTARPLAQNFVEWSQLWSRAAGNAEQFASGGWPNEEGGDFGHAPAARFDTRSLSGAVAQGLRADQLGATIAGLPHPPADWFQRCVGRFDPAPRPDELTPAQRRAAGKGVYDPQVESKRATQRRQAEGHISASKRQGVPPVLGFGADLIINADNEDVGAAIKQANLADDALVAITGSGRHESSPIQLTGRSLRLQFIPTGNDDLTLVPRDKQSPALIEVIDGNLEIEGAGLTVNADESSALRWLVHVEGGNLVLKNCRLRGPATQAPPYESAVCWQRGGASPSVEEPKAGDEEPPLYSAYALLSDCYLVGAGRLIDAELSGRALFLTNNVFVATNDLMRLTINDDLDGFGAFVELANNTACVLGKGAFFEVPLSHNVSDSARPLRFSSQNNLFCKAFDLASEKPALLRCDDTDFHRGLLSWQETSNAYSNLGRYLVLPESAPTHDQDFRGSWLSVWGRAHVERFSVDLAAQFESDRFSVAGSTPDDFALGDASEVPEGVGADVSRLAAPVTARTGPSPSGRDSTDRPTGPRDRRGQRRTSN